MATSKDRVIVELVADAKGFNKAMKEANQSLKQIEKSSKSTARSMNFFRGGAIAAGVTMFAVQLRDLAKAFIEVNIALEQTEKSFTAVFGSTAVGAREMEYVKGVANEMGAEFLSLTKSYASLSAAAKGTALEGKQTRDIFEAVTRAMGKLGKSAADTDGALKAIEQMISKGTITAEEWKGQLGERLPGAMQILATALGKTTSEIMDMMEAGEILSTSTLPEVTKQINRLYDDGERVEGLIQSWNRFKNAVVETADEINEATGATKALSDVLEVLAGLLSSSDPSDYADSLERLSDWAVNTARSLNDLITPMEQLKRMALDWQYGDAIADVLAPTEGSTFAEALSVTRSGIELEASEIAAAMAGEEKAVKKAAAAYRELRDEMDPLSKARADYESNITVLDEALKLGVMGRGEYTQEALAVQKQFLEEVAKAQRTPSSTTGGGRRRSGKTGASADERAEKRRLRDLEKSVEYVRRLRGELNPLIAIQNDHVDTMNELSLAHERNVISMDEYTVLARKVAAASTEAVTDIDAEAGRLNEVADDMGAAFAGAFDDIVLGAEDATQALEGMLRSIAGSIFKQGVSAPIGEGISGFISELFADGGVTSTGLPHGVYNRPTAFPINGPSGRFANGTGILGEAGPEAIMPLTRRNGKLGVEGGGVNVNVTNYAGADIETRQGINPGDIDIIVGKVSNDISRGGSIISRSIEGAYGLTRGRLRG